MFCVCFHVTMWGGFKITSLHHVIHNSKLKYEITVGSIDIYTTRNNCSVLLVKGNSTRSCLDCSAVRTAPSYTPVRHLEAMITSPIWRRGWRTIQRPMLRLCICVVQWCGSFKSSTYRVGVVERARKRERERELGRIRIDRTGAKVVLL